MVQDKPGGSGGSAVKILIILIALLVYGVCGVPVAHAQSNDLCGKQACRQLYFYDGNSNLQYVCEALQTNSLTQFKRSDSTLTNIVVSSNTATATTSTAHKLYPGAFIRVSGATVATTLNANSGASGYVILTTPSSTTFTFTTVAVADGTYTESTLVVSTNDLPTNVAKWHITVNTYSGTTFTGKYHAAGAVTFGLACDNRANY